MTGGLVVPQRGNVRLLGHSTELLKGARIVAVYGGFDLVSPKLTVLTDRPGRIPGTFRALVLTQRDGLTVAEVAADGGRDGN